MTVLVYGGSGSGKSEFAEKLVTECSCADDRYYVATMQPYGEEGRKRVERHRKLRAGKGFQTIECPRSVEGALSRIPEPERSTVLLECISNLVANEMFDSPFGEPGLTERVMSGIRQIAGKTKHLILVSVNVFEDGTDYSEETLRYMAYLGQVNRQIASLADQVYEVVAGIPVQIK